MAFNLMDDMKWGSISKYHRLKSMLKECLIILMGCE